MKLKILTRATDDLHEGFRFYERQSPGLGPHFFRALFSNVDALIEFAGIHPMRYGHYRLLSKRFPYAVFYKIEDDVVVVRRILDTRRDPSQIRKALK